MCYNQIIKHTRPRPTHHKEIRIMLDPKDLNFTPTSTNSDGSFRNTRCGAGQSVYDAVAEGIADGWYPPNASVGDMVRGPAPLVRGPAPENAIAEVTVRARESFWIVV
jgi:hypothetical protein